MPNDINHIPPIVPSRDTETHYPRSAGKKATRGSGGSSRGTSSGGAGIWARLFITVSLVVAAIACAWAWQLQEQLVQATNHLERADLRIGELEDRLADTDEGLSQNTAAMAVKINESETEIRKLWDDRKKMNPKIAVLQSKTAGNAKNVAAAQKSLTAAQAQLKTTKSDLAKLNTVAGDLDRLVNSGKANQSEVERVADELNRINLELSKVGKRVKSNEEWVGSINANRSQVNAALTRLQADIRALQVAP